MNDLVKELWRMKKYVELASTFRGPHKADISGEKTEK